MNANKAIEADVAAWHEADTDLPLSEWLGMTKQEYQAWVEAPACLRLILNAHRFGRTFKPRAMAAEGRFGIAARGLKVSELDEVVAWLKRTGRL